MSKPDSETSGAPQPAKPRFVFTDEIFTQICERLCEGEILRKISKELGFSRVGLYHFIDSDATKTRANRYARAREMQMEAHEDDLITTAEDSSGDTIHGENGPRMDSEWVARSRLKIDTKKWVMSKLYPRRYGEKIEATVTGNLGVELTGTLSVEQRMAKLREQQAADDAP